MRIIQKLKFYVKEAIPSGKFVCKSDKSRVVLTGPTPFKDFISRLDAQEWNRFEAAERAFRQTISSGNIYEEKFICKGDFGKWRRIIKIVSGVLVKGGEFQKTKSNGQPWDINFSKFCFRVLKCLPIDPSLRELENDLTIIMTIKTTFLCQ